MPYTWANYSTASSTATILVYPQWTTTGTTTLTWPNSNLQSLWNTTTSGQTYDPGWQWGWHPQNQPRTLAEAYQPPSREELDRMYADERQRTERRQAARARITGRAEALLFSLLDEEQVRTYLQAGWFDVVGSAGGRYRIRRNGQAGNIDELPARGDDRVASLCIHPYGGFCDADAHAAQYLALVTDEPGFRRTANRTPHRRRPAGMAA